jgi:hypothetical protein
MGACVEAQIAAENKSYFACIAFQEEDLILLHKLS